MKQIAILVSDDGAKYKVTKISEGHSKTSEPARPARLYRFDGEQYNRLEEWDVEKPGRTNRPKDDVSVIEEAKERARLYEPDDSVVRVVRRD